jgi:hypothetical protein
MVRSTGRSFRGLVSIVPRFREESARAGEWSVHNLGLLFDVDGPIASPVTRTIAIRSIVTDLVAMTAAGVPIAFITGRSGDFIRHQVVAPLCDAGLGDALESHGARMFGVFEKGGAWAPVTGEGMGEVAVDASVASPLRRSTGSGRWCGSVSPTRCSSTRRSAR